MVKHKSCWCLRSIYFDTFHWMKPIRNGSSRHQKIPLSTQKLMTCHGSKLGSGTLKRVQKKDGWFQADYRSFLVGFPWSFVVGWIYRRWILGADRSFVFLWVIMVPWRHGEPTFPGGPLRLLRFSNQHGDFFKDVFAELVYENAGRRWIWLYMVSTFVSTKWLKKHERLA